MPDPAWSTQYATSQSPEQNGFTRQFYPGTPESALTIVTGGPAANRRVEIASTAETGVVFVSSQEPSLNSSVGATAEVNVTCSGAGNAGFELHFLDRVANIYAYEDRIEVFRPEAEGGLVSFPTPSNAAQTLLRLTYDPASELLRAYRTAAASINWEPLGSVGLSPVVRPFRQVLFWGEGGEVQTFRTMKVYLGGAVAPG